METNLSKYNNDWYKSGKNAFVRFIWYCVNAVFINTYHLPSSGLKKILLRMFGATIGKGVVIKPKVNIKYPWKLTIGDYSWIGEKVWIDNLDQVTIGKNCCLSQEAMVFCGNHNFKKSTFDLIVKPVTLEDGVWLGAKSITCPGVIASKNAILSVGSVATNNLDSNSIYQGNPAEKKKERIIES